MAVVLHEPLLGGATTSLLRVLGDLERRGWSFTFWVPGRGAAEAELRRRGYEVAGGERLMRFSLASLREAPGIARRLASVPGYLRGARAWLRSQDAALVHANTLLSLPELVTRPRSGPPVVLHAHEMLPAGLKGAAAARLARRADVVVAVSGAVAAGFGARGLEARVVHNGVQLPGGAQQPGGNGRLVVGTLGTVCRRKGSDLFLAASRLVRSRLGEV
ncbi:MAG: hypothetical protein QOE60_2128 [Thermoleophilaceae bacterium]|nr:hypothetical protein [Thermoleophilaceae bacterium]